jgi:hypothetical protein
MAEGFQAAVNEGSAMRAFDVDVAVAGKTGSCSGVGWFAAYAPAGSPETVVVVLLRPGNGHRAAHVAGDIFRDLYSAPPWSTPPIQVRRKREGGASGSPEKEKEKEKARGG